MVASVLREASTVSTASTDKRVDQTSASVLALVGQQLGVGTAGMAEATVDRFPRFDSPEHPLCHLFQGVELFLTEL
jgi:hypothetical protein